MILIALIAAIIAVGTDLVLMVFDKLVVFGNATGVPAAKKSICPWVHTVALRFLGADGVYLTEGSMHCHISKEDFDLIVAKGPSFVFNVSVWRQPFHMPRVTRVVY